MPVHSEHCVYTSVFKVLFMHVWVCVYVIPGVDMSQHVRNLRPQYSLPLYLYERSTTTLTFPAVKGAL